MNYTEEQVAKIKELEIEMDGKYLTEERLGKVLEVLFPSSTWDHDKKFLDSNFRPDYCCHSLRICVEFDGPDHYRKVDVIQADKKKDKHIRSLGYKVVRVPYFIQLTKESIDFLFNLAVDFNYNFKHGFISRTVLLPSSFCEQGIWKFKDFLSKIGKGSEMYCQIKESLEDKISRLKLSREQAIVSIVPSSLLLPLGLLDIDYDSEQNQNIVCSNLRDNRNCVLLESSQTIRELGAVFDMNFNYDSEGNISGYTFKLLQDEGIFSYRITLEYFSKDEDSVNLKVYINDLLGREYTGKASDISLFDFPDLIF